MKIVEHWLYIHWPLLEYQPTWGVIGHKKDASGEEPWVSCFVFPKTQALWSSKCYFLSLQEVWGKPGTMPSHNSLPNKYVYHLIWSVLNKWQQVTEQQSRKKKVQHVFWLQESLIQSFGTEAKNRTLIPFECPQSPTFLYHTKWPGRKVLDI